ncbi:MAG: hypothetical protein RLP44_15815 [Aggregatilineales bacterium]
MSRFKGFLYAVFLLCIAPAIVLAQDNLCPTIVETALQAADLACTDTGRNQACYGNVLINAEPTDAATDFVFDTTGDIVDLTEIQSLLLNGLDEATQEWGVAILRVQANIPNSLPGQNVTFVLFGDVEIADASADGQNPMQAFYFSNGIGESACSEAPSGMLVQTPEGVAEVSLTMNGVDVTLGSTAFIQASAPDEETGTEGALTFNLLEGGATVTADGTAVDVEAGMFTTIPLDEDLNAAGEPAEPEPYATDGFEFLPTTLLESDIEIAGMDSTEQTDAGGGTDALNINTGTWTMNFTDISGCGMTSAMLGAMSGQTVNIESTDLQAFFGAAMNTGIGTIETEGITFNIIRPEPNVFGYTADIEGSSMEATYTIIDPNTIEWSMAMDAGDCVMTFTGTMNNGQ